MRMHDRVHLRALVMICEHNFDAEPMRDASSEEMEHYLLIYDLAESCRDELLPTPARIVLRFNERAKLCTF